MYFDEKLKDSRWTWSLKVRVEAYKTNDNVRKQHQVPIKIFAKNIEKQLGCWLMTSLSPESTTKKAMCENTCVKETKLGDQAAVTRVVLSTSPNKRGNK